MAASLVLVFLVLRAGLEIRKRRHRRLRPLRELRERHLRYAGPAIAMVMAGLVGGVASAIALRGWEPLHSVHAWLGLLTAALCAAAATLGHRLKKARNAREAHALLGLLAALASAITALAGFVLLP